MHSTDITVDNYNIYFKISLLQMNETINRNKFQKVIHRTTKFETFLFIPVVILEVIPNFTKIVPFKSFKTTNLLFKPIR